MAALRWSCRRLGELCFVPVESIPAHYLLVSIRLQIAHRDLVVHMAKGRAAPIFGLQRDQLVQLEFLG